MGQNDPRSDTPAHEPNATCVTAGAIRGSHGEPSFAPFDLARELETYVASNAAERAMVERTRAYVLAHRDAFERTSQTGHVTGSAWIVDRAGAAAVLLHHRKLDMWLQPGGHADGERDVRGVALREAREETGLTSLVLATPRIYDIDVHEIPARGDEPAHAHFDVRFALYAERTEAPRHNSESHAISWIPFDAVERYAIDDSVRRLIAKTPALVRVPPESAASALAYRSVVLDPAEADERS